MIFSTLAQAQIDCPSVTYKGGRLNKITNLNREYKNDWTCKLGRYSGTIRSLVYPDEADTEPIAVIIQLANGRREQIGLDEAILECFSEADKRNWQSKLKKGMRVKVQAFSCGASGSSDKQMFSIEFL